MAEPQLQPAADAAAPAAAVD
ncbi:unnamed protein product, partial [Tilletia controversa]